jgi:tRNA A37 threonylcarbamoyladenosine synthetase subunit TsaC/SUA5/YrdC
MAEKTAEKKIYYVRKRPAAHPLSEHQKDLIEASHECGIEKGITRAELVDKMRNCVPGKYKEVKARRENVKEGD